MKHNDFEPHFVVGEFVVGEANRIAHTAVLAAAKNSEMILGPVFVHGVSGVGKTHLLKCAEFFAVENILGAKILPLSAAEALGKHDPAELPDAFWMRYENRNLLLIDDFHRLLERESFCADLCRLLLLLHARNGKIVLSGALPPAEIVARQPCFRWIFESGFFAEMKKPDFDLRFAVLQKRNEDLPKPLPDEALAWIAEQIDSNFRALEGALTHVALLSGLQKKAKIAVSDVKLFLADFLREIGTPNQPTSKPNRKSKSKTNH